MTHLSDYLTHAINLFDASISNLFDAWLPPRAHGGTPLADRGHDGHRTDMTTTRYLSPLHTLMEPVLDWPPSALTRDDWVGIYGEEAVEWMELTPEARLRQTCELWATFFALGGSLDDDEYLYGDLHGHEDDAWRPRPADAPSILRRSRRLGI